VVINVWLGVFDCPHLDKGLIQSFLIPKKNMCGAPVWTGIRVISVMVGVWRKLRAYKHWNVESVCINVKFSGFWLPISSQAHMRCVGYLLWHLCSFLFVFGCIRSTSGRSEVGSEVKLVNGPQPVIRVWFNHSSYQKNWKAWRRESTKNITTASNSASSVNAKKYQYDLWMPRGSSVRV